MKPVIINKKEYAVNGGKQTMELENRVRELNSAGYNCAESVAYALGEYYGITLPSGIATPFGGGGCGRKYLCGAVSGTMMIAGCLFGRKNPGDDKIPSYEKCLEIMQKMEEKYGSCLCAELTEGMDDETLRKQKCQNMMVDAAFWASEWAK